MFGNYNYNYHRNDRIWRSLVKLGDRLIGNSSNKAGMNNIRSPNPRGHTRTCGGEGGEEHEGEDLAERGHEQRLDGGSCRGQENG